MNARLSVRRARRGLDRHGAVGERRRGPARRPARSTRSVRGDASSRGARRADARLRRRRRPPRATAASRSRTAAAARCASSAACGRRAPPAPARAAPASRPRCRARIGARPGRSGERLLELRARLGERVERRRGAAHRGARLQRDVLRQRRERGHVLAQLAPAATGSAARQQQHQRRDHGRDERDRRSAWAAAGRRRICWSCSCIRIRASRRAAHEAAACRKRGLSSSVRRLNTGQTSAPALERAGEVPLAAQHRRRRVGGEFAFVETPEPHHLVDHEAGRDLAVVRDQHPRGARTVVAPAPRNARRSITGSSWPRTLARPRIQRLAPGTRVTGGRVAHHFARLLARDQEGFAAAGGRRRRPIRRPAGAPPAPWAAARARRSSSRSSSNGRSRRDLQGRLRLSMSAGESPACAFAHQLLQRRPASRGSPRRPGACPRCGRSPGPWT